MLQQWWNVLVLTILRPMLKWILRRVTGKCELQRIIYATQPGANRTLSIEQSISQSKCAAVKKVLKERNLELDEVVKEICHSKDVIEDVHPKFGPALKLCFNQIRGYSELLEELETIRQTKYSSDNAVHEDMLNELWNQLCPDTSLENRITKQWGDIGFQGDDPMTDFRGMGILGLQNLIFLVTRHTSVARQLLQNSHHPKYGFSFAIVGINITGMAFSLMRKEHLRTHFYNAVPSKPKVEHFHLVYCYLLAEFTKFWRDEKPKDIMEFNVIREKYEKQIISMLKSDMSTVLKANSLS